MGYRQLKSEKLIAFSCSYREAPMNLLNILILTAKLFNKNFKSPLQRINAEVRFNLSTFFCAPGNRRTHPEASLRILFAANRVFPIKRRQSFDCLTFALLWLRARPTVWLSPFPLSRSSDHVFNYSFGCVCVQ